MKSGLIIERDLFAGAYVAQGIEEDVPVDDLHIAVGLARMVDIVRAVAAATAVDTPSSVYVADAQLGAASAPSCFPVRDSFARVLSDFSPARERNRRKAALAIDRRFAYRQAVRQFEFHIWK